MREASDASGRGAPPRPSTIHSATLNQRVPRAASGQWRRIHAYLASVHIALGGWPGALRRSPAARPRAAAPPARRAGRARRSTGRPGAARRRSSTPVSAMPATPTPATRRPSSAASAAVIAAASSSPGSSSVPRHGVGARPWASSCPAASTTAALIAVVPTSNPSAKLSISPIPICRRDMYKDMGSALERRPAGHAGADLGRLHAPRGARTCGRSSYEPRVGGAERGLTPGGGKVTVWEPPRRFAHRGAERRRLAQRARLHARAARTCTYVHTSGMQDSEFDGPVRRLRPAHDASTCTRWASTSRHFAGREPRLSSALDEVPGYDRRRAGARLGMPDDARSASRARRSGVVDYRDGHDRRRARRRRADPRLRARGLGLAGRGRPCTRSRAGRRGARWRDEGRRPDAPVRGADLRGRAGRGARRRRSWRRTARCRTAIGERGGRVARRAGAAGDRRPRRRSAATCSPTARSSRPRRASPASS